MKTPASVVPGFQPEAAPCGCEYFKTLAGLTIGLMWRADHPREKYYKLHKLYQVYIVIIIAPNNHSASFAARIMFPFQDQDAGREIRGDLVKMQRGGESAWPTAEDDHIMLWHIVL